MNIYEALYNIEETLAGDYREEYEVIENFILTIENLGYGDDLDIFEKSDKIISLFKKDKIYE